MGAGNRSNRAAPAGTTPEEERTRAQAAFDRHRAARMWPYAGGAGQPFMSPYPYGMPGWTFPPASAAMMPQIPAYAGTIPQYSIPGQANTSIGTGKSLFESIGSMISLGVNVINTGLAGGLQVIGGLSGHGSPYCGSTYQACCCPQPFSCCCCGGHHDHAGCCCGHGGYTCGYWCQPSCNCCCCCTPSVYNCC